MSPAPALRRGLFYVCPWVKVPPKNFFVQPGEKISISIDNRREKCYACFRYESTECKRAGSYSNGEPHKSCMRLGHTNGRAPITQYKEI